ncbi:MAG: hypothetical protein ACRDXB_07045, partial [Actinomycetes bacterium]
MPGPLAVLQDGIQMDPSGELGGVEPEDRDGPLPQHGAHPVGGLVPVVGHDQHRPGLPAGHGEKSGWLNSSDWS